MYDLIVFDWDGTLMDSESRIVACMQAAAADLSWNIPDYDATKDIIGLGLNEAVARLFPGRDAVEVQQLADQYRLHFLADHIPGSVLFDGARELLSHLTDNDYLIAVATGKSRRGLKKEFESTGLGPLFHASRCADETFSKPNPQMLLEILDQLGVEADRTLVVGDTEYDIQMAINAGAHALGVSYGVHERDRLLNNGALACLDTLNEIPDWLARMLQPSTQ